MEEGRKEEDVDSNVSKLSEKYLFLKVEFII